MNITPISTAAFWRNAATLPSSRRGLSIAKCSSRKSDPGTTALIRNQSARPRHPSIDKSSSRAALYAMQQSAAPSLPLCLWPALPPRCAGASPQRAALWACVHHSSPPLQIDLHIRLGNRIEIGAPVVGPLVPDCEIHRSSEIVSCESATPESSPYSERLPDPGL